MVKKSVILGCSHAAGAEMYSQDVSNCVERGYKESYPCLISQEFGYLTENHSLYSGSNDAMFRIFVEALPDLTDQDLVICCWTGAHRSEIFHDDHKDWIQFTASTNILLQRKKTSSVPEGHFFGPKIDHHDEYLSYVKSWQRFGIDKNRWSSRYNQLKNILAVNCLAEKNGIKVWNFFSFDVLSKDLFTDVCSFVWPLGRTSFLDWAIAQDFPQTEKKHFQKDAHRAYADFAISLIKNQNLLNDQH